MTKIVRIVLYQGDKILLVQSRRLDELSKWELPGGKIEEYESYVTAARRELREETGIRLAKVRPLLIWDRKTPFGNYTRHVVFQATSWYGSIAPEDTDEIRDVQWFPLLHLPNIDPWSMALFALIARNQ